MAIKKNGDCSMPSCPNCGKSIGEEDRFCRACGYKLPRISQPIQTEALNQEFPWKVSERRYSKEGYMILFIYLAVFMSGLLYCYLYPKNPESIFVLFFLIIFVIVVSVFVQLRYRPPLDTSPQSDSQPP